MAKLKLSASYKIPASLAGRNRNIDKALSAAAKSAAFAIGNVIMTDAKRRTPVDTGVLRGSGFVSLPQATGRSSARVEVGFGGPAEAYAIVQHEDLSLMHEVGEPKFLERAADLTASQQREAAFKSARRAIKTARVSAPKIHNRTTDGEG